MGRRTTSPPPASGSRPGPTPFHRIKKVKERPGGWYCDPWDPTRTDFSTSLVVPFPWADEKRTKLVTKLFFYQPVKVSRCCSHEGSQNRQGLENVFTQLTHNYKFFLHTYTNLIFGCSPTDYFSMLWVFVGGYNWTNAILE